MNEEPMKIKTYHRKEYIRKLIAAWETRGKGYDQTMEEAILPGTPNTPKIVSEYRQYLKKDIFTKEDMTDILDLDSILGEEIAKTTAFIDVKMDQIEVGRKEKRSGIWAAVILTIMVTYLIIYLI